MVAFIFIHSIYYFHLKLLLIFTFKKTPYIFTLMAWLLFRTRFILKFIFFSIISILTSISINQT